MDVVMISQAIQKGVSIVCATCDRYWEGRRKGLPEPQCTAVEACGSPFAKLAFPQYVGPITDFTRWCFVCGGKATKGIKVGDNPRVIGMCSEHISMLGQVEPIRVKLPDPENVDIIDPGRGRISLRKYFGRPLKTLRRLLAGEDL